MNTVSKVVLTQLKQQQQQQNNNIKTQKNKNKNKKPSALQRTGRES
jgi:hypothetical protein